MKRVFVFTSICVVLLSVSTAFAGASAGGDCLPLDYEVDGHPVMQPQKWSGETLVQVGYRGTGTVNISSLDSDPDISITAKKMIIGEGTGGVGSVTVEGEGAVFEFNAGTSNLYGTVCVGNDGQGTLDILDGGKMYCHTVTAGSVSDSYGKVTVSGAGSELILWETAYSPDLVMGYSGQGELTVSDGGYATARFLRLGYGYTGSGVATIDNAIVDCTQTVVGYYGQGQLNIINGGTLNSSNKNAYISYDSYLVGSNYNGSGTVNVKGAGSTWNLNGGDLIMAQDGSAELNIENGGIVNVFNDVDSNLRNGHVYLGQTYRYDQGDVTGRAVLTVKGIGSALNIEGDLHVGYKASSGVLEIANGGLVKVDGSIIIYDEAGDMLNMANGGMLAILGAFVDMDAFMTNISVGTEGSLNFWDGTSYLSYVNFTEGVDYTLNYHSGGDMAGYTVLTAVPEPATLALFGLGGLVLRRRRR